MKKFFANQDDENARQSGNISHNDFPMKPEPAPQAETVPPEKSLAAMKAIAVQFFLHPGEVAMLKRLFFDFDLQGNADVILRTLAISHLNLLIAKELEGGRPLANASAATYPPPRHDNPLLIPQDDLPPDCPAAVKLALPFDYRVDYRCPCGWQGEVRASSREALAEFTCPRCGLRQEQGHGESGDHPPDLGQAGGA